MRILIYSVAYFPVEGGAEIATKEITDRIGDIEFDMVTLRHDPRHPSRERIGNVDVYRVDSSKIGFPLRAAWFGIRLHRERKYDAVWSIMAVHAGVAAFLFRLRARDVRYILTLQEGHPIEYMARRSRWIRPLLRRVIGSADVIQAISTYLAGYARAMGFAGRVEVVPNGVDVEAFRASGRSGRDENVTLITTSRLVEKNAVGDIIHALLFLPSSVRLKIIGTGSLEEQLRDKAAALGLTGRVEFLGHLRYEEIPAHLHAADVFIRPSLSEGFGNSFIEAMAAGVPVIATPVGGIVDFIRHGETGLFCEVRNPRSIAHQVEALIADPGLAARLRKNGVKLAEENYSWDLVAEQMRRRVLGD